MSFLPNTCVILAVVSTTIGASIIGPTATMVALTQPTTTGESYDANPQYSFTYVANGNGFTGETEGPRRIVPYASPMRGFNAAIRNDQTTPSNEAPLSSNTPVFVVPPAQYLHPTAIIAPQNRVPSRSSVTHPPTTESMAVVASGSPNLRQSAQPGPSVTASNIMSPNGGLIGPIPWNIRLPSPYSIQPVIATATGVVRLQ